MHADVWVDAHDRQRLERLCRYICRPAVATERLSEGEDGRIVYGLRHAWSDGTTAVEFEPLELIEKLVAIVPAPRGHLVRYHGVLAPHARWRNFVVRDRVAEEVPQANPPGGPGVSPVDGPGQRPGYSAGDEQGELRERRLSWAELMRRVYEVDVLECPRCHGRRKLIAVVTDPAVIARFLGSLGLPTRAPPRGPVRGEGPEEADLGEGESDGFDEGHLPIWVLY